MDQPTQAGSVRKLSDAQTQAFDTVYMDSGLWRMLQARIDSDFPDGDFRFLDLGGGNGSFADSLLDRYPRSTGLLIDNSNNLLSANAPHPRKSLVCDTVENLGLHPEFGGVDIVFCNWFLHHMVTDSYRGSLKAIRSVLRSGKDLLSERGRLSIFDVMHDGILIDFLPSLLIYHLTSASWFAPIARRLGANSAGTGVCLLSQARWSRVIADAGLEVLSYTDDNSWKVKLHERLLLHMGHIRVGHFWAR